MPIDGLSSTSALLAALRGEIAPKSQRTGATQARQTREASELSVTKRPQNKAKLRAELGRIVRETPLRDEETIKGIRKRMVRAMLLAEFGPELREHAEWQPMLDTITQALEASEPHRAAFRELIDELS